MSLDTFRNRTTTTDKILCIGVAALDTIATIQTFPKPDEKLRSESILTSGGGNAANTSVAISRISSSFLLPNTTNNPLRVDLLSAVGDDANGDTIVNELTSQGVGVERMQRYPGVSPWCYIMVATSQNTRTCIFQPGSAELSVEHIQQNVLTAVDGVVKDDCGILGEYRAAHFDGRHLEGSVYLAKHLDRLAIPYSVDVERPRGAAMLELLRGASIVVCNSTYCGTALGLDGERPFDEKEIVANLRKVLREQAPRARIGVTTLGSRGSCLVILGEEDAVGGIHGGRVNDFDVGSAAEQLNIVLETHDKFPDSPRVIEKHGALWCDAWRNCNIIDTTGAGDVFQGAFLATLWSRAASAERRRQQNCEEENATNESSTAPPPFKVPMEKMVLAHALRIGTRVAGLKLNGVGPRVALPGTDEFLESELKASAV